MNLSVADGGDEMRQGKKKKKERKRKKERKKGCRWHNISQEIRRGCEEKLLARVLSKYYLWRSKMSYCFEYIVFFSSLLLSMKRSSIRSFSNSIQEIKK